MHYLFNIFFSDFIIFTIQPEHRTLTARIAIIYNHLNFTPVGYKQTLRMNVFKIFFSILLLLEIELRKSI